MGKQRLVVRGWGPAGQAVRGWGPAGQAVRGVVVTVAVSEVV